MAKVVGLVGSASGKIGNVVYAVTNGIQVARVYQPVVSNPKSALQNMQRAKGNLVGRISSFVPRTAIMGLGNNNRIRRGEFLRILLKAAFVALYDGAYQAKVASEDVIFSKGAVPISVVTPSFTATGNNINITLYGPTDTAISAADYAAMQTRLVVMVYDATSQELVEVVTKIVNKPDQGASSITNILVAHTAGYVAKVYAIPMSTADGSSVSIDTSIATLSDNDIAAKLNVNGNAVVFTYGKSVLLGQATYTPVP